MGRCRHRRRVRNVRPLRVQSGESRAHYRRAAVLRCSHLEPGPRDQRPAESREDVLVYSTPAFSVDTEVTGPVHLEVYAKSSAVDTDFTGKLVEFGRTDSRRTLPRASSERAIAVRRRSRN